MEKGCAGPSQGTKGTLAPQGFLSLSDYCLTSTPCLIPTFCLLFPLCFCPREQCLKVGHGEELFPQGTLVSLCPQLPPPTGLGRKGALCMLKAGEEEGYYHHN